MRQAHGKVAFITGGAGGIGLGMAQASSATYADRGRMLNVNLDGVVNGAVAFMPRISAHAEGGHIVNTSSIASIVALDDDGGMYSAGK